MLLKIISTTDGQFVGKCVEYNDKEKTLTLPSGEHLSMDEETIDEKKYILKNSNYIINAEKTI